MFLVLLLLVLHKLIQYISTAKNHHPKRLMLASFWALEDVKSHPKESYTKPCCSFQNLIVLEVVSFYKWWKIVRFPTIVCMCFSGSICSVLKGSRVQNFQDQSSCCISIGFRTEKTVRCLPMLWMPFPGTATPPQRQWNLHIVDFTVGISYARRTIFRVPR